MPSILTKQVLIRFSQTGEAAWKKCAEKEGVTTAVAVRRVMARACGVERESEDVAHRVAEGKISRATHMRKFIRGNADHVAASSEKDVGHASKSPLAPGVDAKRQSPSARAARSPTKQELAFALIGG